MGVWSLEYSASPVTWKGSTMPLTDRALNVLATLDASGIGARPIIFVAHSFGGLLVKQMLRSARDLGEPKWEAIQQQTKGIVFLSTPHSGSGLATWVRSFGALLGTSVTIKELEANEPHLRDLNLWYRSNAAKLDIATEVYFEKQKTAGIRIVDETTSDPGIAGVIPVPMDANHWTIAKPDSRVSVMYTRTRRFVSNAFPGPAALRAPFWGNKIAVKIVLASRKRPRTESDALAMLQSVSSTVFPDADKPFPEGTYYRPQNATDHLYYVLSRPTAALRAAIEFMQKWHATSALG